MYNVLTCYAIWCGLMTPGLSQTVQEAKDLTTQLFTTNAYDFRIRPIANQSLPLDVNVSMSLYSLNEVNDVEGTITTTAYLTINWFDSELTWTPATYGGISGMNYPQNQVWKPDLALKNTINDYTQLGTPQLNVYVTYDGMVQWFPLQVLTSTCSLDISNFPFDVQICSMTFVAWSYDSFEVNLIGVENGIDLYSYEENSAWELLDSAYSMNGGASITFTLKIQRKPMYAIVFLVLPILFLTLTNLFSFVLPCESGERSGYTITVFLAFAVYLTIVTSSMPASSDTVAMFSVYILIMTSTSTLVTLLSLGMIRLTTFDAQVTPIPKWLIVLARLGKCKPCRNSCRRNQVNAINEKEAIDTDNIGKQEYCADVVQKQYTWKAVVNGLDAVCFVFFGLLSIFFTIILLAVASARGAADGAADI